MFNKDLAEIHTYKGTLIKLSADFSRKTLQDRKEWHNILKGMKGKSRQPRALYPEGLIQI